MRLPKIPTFEKYFGEPLDLYSSTLDSKSKIVAVLDTFDIQVYRGVHPARPHNPLAHSLGYAVEQTSPVIGSVSVMARAGCITY